MKRIVGDGFWCEKDEEEDEDVGGKEVDAEGVEEEALHCLQVKSFGGLVGEKTISLQTFIPNSYTLCMNVYAVESCVNTEFAERSEAVRVADTGKQDRCTIRAAVCLGLAWDVRLE